MLEEGEVVKPGGRDVLHMVFLDVDKLRTELGLTDSYLRASESY